MTIRRAGGLYFMVALLCLCSLTIPAQALEMDVTEPSNIVIGGDSDYPPYEFLDKNGKLA